MGLERHLFWYDTIYGDSVDWSRINLSVPADCIMAYDLHLWAIGI